MKMSVVHFCHKHEKQTVKGVFSILKDGISCYSKLLVVGLFFFFFSNKLIRQAEKRTAERRENKLVSAKEKLEMFGTRGPLLERPGNLSGPISVFGDKCFLAEGHFC